jgi:AraC-like DNA-binding protein
VNTVAQTFPASPRLPLSYIPPFTSGNLDDVRDHVGKLYCPHHLDRSKSTASIQFRTHTARLGRVVLNCMDYGSQNGTITAETSVIDSHYLVQISLNGSCSILQERDWIDIPRGHVCIIDPRRRLIERMSADYAHLMLCIPQETMQAELAHQMGYHPREPVVFAPKAFDLRQASGFGRMVGAICEDLESTGDFARPHTSPHIEEALVSLILDSIPHQYSEALNRVQSGATPYYVRRATAYILEHARDQIGMEDIIQASGVSARSLYAGFRAHHDRAPMEFLKAYRLDLVRRELMQAARNGRSVTDIALGCGFNHLSKFAHDYRARFGETPSQTRLAGGG